jgi:hypothetical protein
MSINYANNTLFTDVSKLFTHENFEAIHENCFSYENCILLIDLKTEKVVFAKGTSFRSIILSNGILEFMKESKGMLSTWIFDMHFFLVFNKYKEEASSRQISTKEDSEKEEGPSRKKYRLIPLYPENASQVETIYGPEWNNSENKPETDISDDEANLKWK